MAPPRFARRPEDVAASAQPFWRGLRFVIVPAGGGGTLGGIKELLHNLSPTSGYATYRGEANGPAANTAAGAGTHFGIHSQYMPTTAPIGVFSFLVRRDSSATIQHLIGNGAASQGGWSFQLNYGAGQIGLTRWNAGDNASTTLGAVPNTGGTPSCVGMSYDGSTVRFFLNGRFQTLASGALVAPSSNNLAVGKNTSSLQALVNTSIHVIYLWARPVSDGEFHALMRDPWAPIRPRVTVYQGSSLTGTARISQVVGEILAQPNPALRLSQLVAEVIIDQPISGPSRVSQAVAEVLLSTASGTGRARLSQALAEVLHAPTPSLRASQIVAEAVVAADVTVRLSQAVAEVLYTSSPTLRASQSVLEVMVTPGVLSVPLSGDLFPRGSPPPFPYT